MTLGQQYNVGEKPTAILYLVHLYVVYRRTIFILKLPYTCMYVIERIWINPVRLPILHVVSWSGKMNISLSPFAPEILVSRDGFGSPVPRQPAHLHTQAQFGAYVRDSSRIPRRRPFAYLKPPYANGSVPSLSSHAIADRWRSLPRVRRHRASKPQGSSTHGCCLFMYYKADVVFSHTH